MSADLVDQNVHIGKKLLLELDYQMLALAENKTSEEISGPDVLKQSVIHFYFCLEGKAGFGFGPHYSREITEGKTYFFYNPERELPFTLSLSSGTRMVILSISLGGIHKLFVGGGDEIHFLKPENVTGNFMMSVKYPAHSN